MRAIIVPPNEVRSESPQRKVYTYVTFLTFATSFPLMAPSRHLHGHRRRRHPHLFPSQARGLGAREANRATLRSCLLDPVHRMPRGRT